MNGVPDLRITRPTGRVRWYRIEEAEAAYDLWPETRLGKGFAERPGRWIYGQRHFLVETLDGALAADSWRPEGPGRVRLVAEMETAAGWRPTREIELRLAESGGFRGTLSECFGMPYVFGIAGVREGDLTGVDTGWGADCSNLLVHAWRRNGHALPWGDPGRLREQMEALQEGVSLDDEIEITARQIEGGLMVDFGNHVAVLWEDREPVGRLDSGDRVLHHLGGRPEILTLEELCRERGTFDLRVPLSGP